MNLPFTSQGKGNMKCQCLYCNITTIIRQIFCSPGRPQPVEQFYWTSNRNFTGRPVNFFIAFLDEIGNSETFEANLQNSSGGPVGFL